MADLVTLDGVSVSGGEDIAVETLTDTRKLPISAIVVSDGDTIARVSTAAPFPVGLPSAVQTALDALVMALQGTVTVAGAVTTDVSTSAMEASLDAIEAAVEGTLDVAVTSLPALPAGANTIGATKVDSSNVNTYHAPTITSGAATSVRTSACRVFHIEWTNSTGATSILGLYDKASAPVSGTDYPRVEVVSTNGSPASRDLGVHGIKFLNGVQAVVYTTARTPAPVASTAATFTLSLDP